MANTKKPQGKPFSLDRYRSEVKGEPFVLWISDEEKIEIPRPTGDQMLDAEEVSRTGTSRDLVQVICGDKADELLALLGPEDATVLKRVTEDMQDHFGMGE